MKNLMEKHTIIKLKQEGYSNRDVAKIMDIDRKTVAKYWNIHQEQLKKLEDPNYDHNLIQEEISSAPKYNSSNRNRPKYTKELDEYLDEILSFENKKDQKLKTHKQNLTVVQIHEMVKDKGFDISYPSICIYVREKRKNVKECFIRQSYDYADRLEYDFGEVKLSIDGKLSTFHLAVLSSPASNFRWAYLYKSQNNEVFLDSQVRFFDMVGGMYKEIVYDNMRNVVSRFIGKNEKEINHNLLILSNYYGFNINVTNCFSGNEKGHVEGSVKIIRKSVFAKKYEFDSFEQAEEYLYKSLIDLNEKSLIKEEIKELLPLRPTFELAKITKQKVNAYSFVQVEKNLYSVPDYLVGKEVTVRIYAREIKIYTNDNLICVHKRKDGANEVSIDIKHYLTSLARKPQAIRNSVALKSTPMLKSIFDNHFIKNPKKFIEIIKENKEKDIDELIDIFNDYLKFGDKSIPVDIVKHKDKMETKTRMIIAAYSNLCVGVKQ